MINAHMIFKAHCGVIRFLLYGIWCSNTDIREYTFTVGILCMGPYLLICTPLPYIESLLHYTSFNYDQSFIHIKEPCL